MSRNRILVVLGAAVAVVLLWYVALWGPAVKSHSAATAQLAAAQQANQTAGAQHASMLARLRKLPAEVALANAVDKAAPAQPGIAEMIDQVSAAASASGVTLQSESQGSPAGNGSSSGSGSASGTTTAGTTTAAATSTLQPLSLSFSVSGKYPQVLAFIRRLQSTPRLITVNALNFGPGGGGTTGQATTPAGGAPAAAGVLTAGAQSALTASITASMYEVQSPLPQAPHFRR